MTESQPGFERAEGQFAERFGEEPQFVVRSPGRVNLIGDHTDYSEGLVLPMAVDRCLWLAGRARSDNLVRLWSESHGWGEFDARYPASKSGWMAYPEGVAFVMGEAESLPGFEGAIISDLPTGGGLSSSAALEMAVVAAFRIAAGQPWDPMESARLGWRVENEWLHLGSGVMDQIACAAGREGDALLIDCRDVSIKYVPIPDQAAIVVLDTTTRRSLTESRYGIRRLESQSAAEALGVTSLRELDSVGSIRGSVDPVLVRRARHVISENARVLAAAAAIAEGDLAELGHLLNSSHASLRDDFEVSGPALDAIVEAARVSPACFGARMTGGGFAGCAIAVVDAALSEEFSGELVRTFEGVTGLRAAVYRCRPVNGTSTSRS
jgi:galactokinase